MITYLMPIYSFEAADRNGNRVQREVEAADINAVKEIIRAENLTPIRIRPRKEKSLLLFEKVTQADLLIFTQELQTLLSSGMQLDRALLILSQHTEKAALKKTLQEVYSDIQKGRSLSQALARHRVFPQLYVNMVKAGEESGHLEPVLKRISAFLETSATLRQELLSSLIYPIFITIVGTLTMAVLMLYVIPKFTVIFEDLGQALPLPTQILIEASNFFLDYWWILGAAMLMGVAALRTYIRTPDGRAMIDRLKLRIPVLQRLHLRLAIARFSRTMGTLLNSGVPILGAIRIAREVIGNTVISEKLAHLLEGVSKGRGIYTPLQEINVFPQIVTQMIAVGEESGTLEETFLIIADRFENESRNMIKRLISFMEPAIILVMALFVGFIVFSMLFAIVGLYDISL